MSAAVTIPCPELPKIPEIPSIKIIGGAELKAFLDLSAGPATDCKLTFSLLLQLSPLLASMACLLKLFNVIGKLQEFAQAATDPLNKLPKAVPGLVDAIADMAPCIPLLAPINLVIMLKGILQLIISFISCLISQLESILKFQATLEIDPASDNTTLNIALGCARKNAETALANATKSIEPLQPIFQMIGVIAGMAGVEVKLPDLSSLSAGADATATIEPLKEAVASLKAAIAALPG